MPRTGRTPNQTLSFVLSLVRCCFSRMACHMSDYAPSQLLLLLIYNVDNAQRETRRICPPPVTVCAHICGAGRTSCSRRFIRSQSTSSRRGFPACLVQVVAHPSRFEAKSLSLSGWRASGMASVYPFRARILAPRSIRNSRSAPASKTVALTYLYASGDLSTCPVSAPSSSTSPVVALSGSGFALQLL
ncbi:hypothetical protein C8Q80DRAFT_302645 [Daedaleopsis nitida]|nr:hypothetical protein C8Q80DRAFT_302645 [Daedaleopsis nitida]